MDFYRQQLAAAEQEILDLIKDQTRLKQKELRGTLTDEEEIDLAGIDELLAFARRNRNDYRELISLALINEPPVSKTFSESDEDWIQEVTGVNVSYRKWTGFVVDETVQPRPGFKKAFEEIGKAFHTLSDAVCRVFLNLFLSDVILRPEFNESLRIFPELDVSVSGTTGFKRQRLYGTMDFAIGFGKGRGMPDRASPTEGHIVAIKFAPGFSQGELLECIAQTASLYKTRGDAGKVNKSVWGICSNADMWKFVFINGDGCSWQSGPFDMNLPWYDEAKVLQVYRIVHYIVKCCYEAGAPHPSVLDGTPSINDFALLNSGFNQAHDSVFNYRDKSLNDTSTDRVG